MDSTMDIGALEFRLLAVFEAVMRERSVTHAGASLGLTQPAISQALGKLRRCLGDPLFVRTPHGMEPTPRAVELAGAVAELLRIARERLVREPSFDARRATRTFSFYSSDAGAAVFTPPIAARLRSAAPQVRIRVLPIVARRFPEGLESGEADLALGSFSGLGAGYYQRRLYEDSYVCLVRAGHPSIGRRLSPSQFFNAHHVIVSAEGTGHAHAAVEKILLRQIDPRRIAARVPSFLAAPVLVAHTDYVLTVPGRVGRVFAKPLGLKFFEPPMELPRFEVKQYWHERYHRDPANRWFREMVADLFGGAGDGSSDARGPRADR